MDNRKPSAEFGPCLTQIDKSKFVKINLEAIEHFHEIVWLLLADRESAACLAIVHASRWLRL